MIILPIPLPMETSMRRVTDYHLIPDHMMKSMINYADHHFPVGDFLKAIICNDLTEAIRRADDTNLWIIPIYVTWFYNEVPGGAWKSKKAYDYWLSLRLIKPENSQ